jgi:hypothetical protein
MVTKLKVNRCPGGRGAAAWSLHGKDEMTVRLQKSRIEGHLGDVTVDGNVTLRQTLKKWRVYGLESAGCRQVSVPRSGKYDNEALISIRKREIP